MTQQIQAVLTFDSFTTSPAFGVRSGPSVARQVLYSAGELDLDLRFAPDDGRWSISGQVLGDCATGKVELVGETGLLTTQLDSLFEFAFEPVTPGDYEMRVRFDDIEIKLPGFSLRT